KPALDGNRPDEVNEAQVAAATDRIVTRSVPITKSRFLHMWRADDPLAARMFLRLIFDAP
ncbi:MAG: hypothetical protein J0H80_21295, partial [Rhizobiales bacterium]|nr:hypothetical protein [Hyphomicrobiales bacterium]